MSSLTLLVFGLGCLWTAVCLSRRGHILLLSILLLLTASARGAEWFVDNHATGVANGTSWANAFTNFTAMWGHPSAGDTVYVSGGPAGGTNHYLMDMDDRQGSTPNEGTLANPITVRVGTESAHNGQVRIHGTMFVSRDYWTVDGSKSAWVPDTVMDTFHIGTNCNIAVVKTNGGYAVQFFGTGSKCKWINVQQSGGSDDGGIYWSSSVSRPLGNGSEIAYCWVHDIYGFGMRSESLNVLSETYGQMAIHHNLVERCADNCFQFAGYVDVYKNVGRYQAFPSVSHPDIIQEVQVFSRIWNNILNDNQGYAVYVEATAALNHDILVYNNLIYSVTNGISSIVDISGSALYEVRDCNLSNIWIFNNTVYNLGTSIPAKFVSWNRGDSTYRQNGSVSNFWVLNNVVIGVAPENHDPTIQLYTNRVTWNGVTGFDYEPSEVRVDYNCITGESGEGRGIVYGAKGIAQVPLDPYDTMADFAVAYPQYANNNNATAAFVSVAGYDFRPQVGDAGIVGKATNLVALLTNIAPECGQDILGNQRGATWDIGAYQIPSGYWVATNGSDLAAGTFAAPWRTIQHAADTLTAGETVNVTTGDYGEYVQTANDGSAGSPITFRAYPANNPLAWVTSKQFEIRNQYIVVEGFKLQKPANSLAAQIYIGSGAGNFILTNNTIVDSVHLFTKSASFGANYIEIQNAYGSATGFLDAGFEAGSAAILGAYEFGWFTNHGANLTVQSVTSNRLTFTTSLTSDPGASYWAAVCLGASFVEGRCGIKVEATTPRMSGLVISGNTISNIAGQCIDLANCDTVTIANNDIAIAAGTRAIRANASDIEIAGNYIHGDGKGVFYFTSTEGLAALAVHTALGGDWYDWYCSLFDIGSTGTTNISFHHNWIQNNYGQMCNFQRAVGATNFVASSNVWVGAMYASASSGIDGMVWDHCTFLRCPYGVGALNMLSMGDTGVTGPQKGILITNCLFINFGDHSSSSSYPYATPDASMEGVWTNNLSLTCETIGWTTTPTLPGLLANAGDPLFVNIQNPLGPDGKPFTDDDGLRPMPNSLSASMGLGALTSLPSSAPIAHFQASLPVPGWKDDPTFNFDSAWLALTAYNRSGPVRPWNTPECIGSNSVAVTFNAASSIDGLSTNNTAIATYSWNFAGTAHSTNSPVASYTFTTPGTNWVTLTVSSSAGSHTASNAYRLLGTAAQTNLYPKQPLGLQILRVNF